MLVEMFNNAGVIRWPLAVCSILALAIILERLWTLARLRQVEDRAFMVLQLALEKDDEAMQHDPQIAAAPVTHVVNALTGLRGATTEHVQQIADIALAMQRFRLRRYLGTLATIGSTSPFIGLFGTVLGVIAAFHDMRTGLNSEKMAGGISEALSATALGLLVAIPSVIAYNYFVGRIQGMLLHIQSHVARLTPLLHTPTEMRQKQEV